MRPADIFISHASEDKEDIARPLAESLRRHGLVVWYDEYVLRLGDSLREVIDRGLDSSRFGVVILSPSFFSKEWPRRELNGLLARESVNGAKVLLPVWHKVTLEEVAHFSPLLADKLAVSTARGLDAVVRQILQVVEQDLPSSSRDFVPPSPESNRPTPLKSAGITIFPTPAEEDFPPTVKPLHKSSSRPASLAPEPIRQDIHEIPALRVQPPAHRLYGAAVARSVERQFYTPIASVIVLSVALAAALTIFSWRTSHRPETIISRNFLTPSPSAQVSVNSDWPFYDPGNRRDPFKSLLAGPDRPEFRGPRPEGVPGLLIDEIDLTGIITTSKGFVAEVMAANQKKSFLLKEGDQLYDGDVVFIGKNEVVFKQIVQDPTALKPFREIVRTLNPQ